MHVISVWLEFARQWILLSISEFIFMLSSDDRQVIVNR